MADSINKGTAVKTLCALWNLSLSDSVAFGDHYNDLEMLEAVGKGFLMGNAPQELKGSIENHTLDNDHDGIFHALEQMRLL